MSDPVPARRPIFVGANGVRLLLLVAFVLFLAAFCVAQGWLTKGTWQEWTSAGLGAWVLAGLL